MDLHSFAEEKLYAATDKEKLKEILTAQSIKTYVAFKKVGKFKKYGIDFCRMSGGVVLCPFV